MKSLQPKTVCEKGYFQYAILFSVKNIVMQFRDMNLLIVVVVLTLLSCSKEEKTADEGTIRYKINGELVTYDNKQAESEDLLYVAGGKNRIYPMGDVFYVIEGHSHKSNKELFQAMIFTDSLLVQNYRYDSSDLNLYGPILNIDHNISVPQPSTAEVRSSLYFAGDYVNINVTSYSNGRVSGTFTARLSPQTANYFDYEKRGSILITEGQFSNVKLTSFN
jgi:hypothetical protein